MLMQDGWNAVQRTNRVPTSSRSRSSFAAFAAEQRAIDQLEADRDAIARQMEELGEEHGGEDGLLADATANKGNLTKASVKSRIADIKEDEDAADERSCWTITSPLSKRKPETGKKVKNSQKELEARLSRNIPSSPKTRLRPW